MAAPQVAGAAALILSVAPSLSATALKADILENVDKLPSLSGRVISGGRLNVCKALPGCGSVPVTAPPANTTLPAITGIARVGRTLSASTGSWTETPTHYSYQWQRCYTLPWTGTRCFTISGAAGQSYTARWEDLFSRLRVTVTATNSAGASSPATSSQTAIVWFPF